MPWGWDGCTNHVMGRLDLFEKGNYRIMSESYLMAFFSKGHEHASELSL